MASLSSKVQNTLDESRILVLGIAVLVGFGFRAFFEPGVETLPHSVRAAKLASLALQLLSFCLVVLPMPYHRIVDGGEDTPGLLRFGTRVMGLALLPFAIGLAGDAAVALFPIAGGPGSVALGIGVAAAAGGAWYVAPGIARARRGARGDEEGDEVANTSIESKIKHVLTEARMVLPGVQALLGFQLAVTLAEAFRSLPRHAQWAHAAAMLLNAAAVVLLVAPAAWHRIVERGEETEGFHRVATRFVVAALVPLACALAIDLGVVVYRVSSSAGKSSATGAVALVVLAVAWFGLPLAARRATHRSAAGAEAARLTAR